MSETKTVVEKCPMCNGTKKRYDDCIHSRHYGDQWDCSSCGPTGKVKVTYRKSSDGDYWLRSKQEEYSCFAKGTKITTPYGLIDIEKLSKGDIVTSIDRLGNASFNRIIKTKRHVNIPIYQIILRNGKVINTTIGHKFLVESKWKKAINIKAGESLFYFEDNFIKIEKVEKSYKSDNYSDVYNIIVERDFNYIAEGVVVHSFSYFQIIRKFCYNMISIYNEHQLEQIKVPSIKF